MCKYCNKKIEINGKKVDQKYCFNCGSRADGVSNSLPAFVMHDLIRNDLEYEYLELSTSELDILEDAVEGAFNTKEIQDKMKIKLIEFGCYFDTDESVWIRSGLKQGVKNEGTNSFRIF
jgi:hypothetical protein